MLVVRKEEKKNTKTKKQTTQNCLFFCSTKIKGTSKKEFEGSAKQMHDFCAATSQAGSFAVEKEVSSMLVPRKSPKKKKCGERKG